jgi:hypothetical protein
MTATGSRPGKIAPMERAQTAGAVERNPSKNFFKYEVKVDVNDGVKPTTTLWTASYEGDVGPFSYPSLQVLVFAAWTVLWLHAHCTPSLPGQGRKVLSDMGTGNVAKCGAGEGKRKVCRAQQSLGDW